MLNFLSFLHRQFRDSHKICSAVPLVILKCRKLWVVVVSLRLPRPQGKFHLGVLLCKVTALSKIFATLILTFPFSSGFIKLLMNSMAGVLTTWRTNIEHCFPLVSTSYLTLTTFSAALDLSCT